MSAPSATESRPSDQPRTRTRVSQRMWRSRTLYLMLLVPVVWLAIYKYAPMGGILLAFKDYRFSDGILASPWADPWYRYFEQFFTSHYFGQLLGNTLLISAYKILWGTVPSLVLALLLNECRVRWLVRWTQTLSYMPHFLSWVIVFGITLAFLSYTGVVNTALRQWTGESFSFLTSTSWFRSILVGSFAWQGLGWGSIIYLAAMAGVDPQRYEAAKIDGANRLRQMWHVTLPSIRPVIILLLILNLGNIMEAGFEQVYIFYNPQVYPVADIIDTWVYRTGLEDLNFPLASAVGLFKSVVGFILIIVANQLAKRWDGAIW